MATRAWMCTVWNYNCTQSYVLYSIVCVWCVFACTTASRWKMYFAVCINYFLTNVPIQCLTCWTFYILYMNICFSTSSRAPVWFLCMNYPPLFSFEHPFDRSVYCTSFIQLLPGCQLCRSGTDFIVVVGLNINQMLGDTKPITNHFSFSIFSGALGAVWYHGSYYIFYFSIQLTLFSHTKEFFS